MKKVAVVYATTGGNAELVAEAVAEGLNESKLKVECMRAELTKAEDLKPYDCVVLVCSTYDVGKLNDKMIRLDSELNTMGEKVFKGKHFEVIGLGDSEHYDIFNGAGWILRDTVKRIGAEQKLETVFFDGYPHGKLKELKQWGIDLAKLI
ncbi:MAG: flavodoxin family protein [Candidatus Dojkabacteria bacterium]